MRNERPDVSAKLNKMDGYLQVLRALMLRDMRTRFGGSHIGYGVVVLWPVFHVFLLVGIFVFQKLPSPMSLDTATFIATGAVPCLIFQYISREVMKSVITNKPLTYYPQVKLFDVLIARIIVEIVTGFLALIVVFAVFFAIGIDPLPSDPFVAVSAYTAAIMLGIGLGTINVGIISFFPGWLMGYMLFGIVLYVTSGVMFLPSVFPNEVYEWFKYNPVVQIIEWMRLAYEPSANLTIDYIYIMIWTLGSLSIGLLLERFVVRKRG
ncbi:ABC transporter permease [Methylobacterium iners]|uniref:Polysialic acid transport protein KpsM n=1 Tax=Methylobacterium iners TaxID=418707 RepID=A0ABQ4S1X1_9HYPH|nr:ABC transporter permease [Methylobacterium iners]GJD96640.1 Polysialic acid transport protein KpsM [Methylobacterium iners]